MSAAASPDLERLTQEAHGLKRAGRHDEAIALYARVTALARGNGAAEHNLAGALCVAERFAEAELAARRAFASRLDAAETWLVLGRALQGQARLDEAEAAYREALKRRPAYGDTVADLAELVWMRTGDVGAALAPIEAAIRSAPTDVGLLINKAKLLEYAGDEAGALLALAGRLGTERPDPRVDIVAAQLLIRRDPPRAAAHARRAAVAAGGDRFALITLAETLLATGEAREAAALAEKLHRAAPDDQFALALLITAWRLLDDPRALPFGDYDALVTTHRIEAPQGWPNLPAFLTDLAATLEALHPMHAHPIGQSPRGGSQTQRRLDLMSDPVLTAFFKAVDKPIRQRIGGLSGAADPLRRSTGRYRIHGAWSVRLRPGGHHVDHLHPKGWLSSAFYVALPAAIDRNREGWLRFGQPGPPTRPALPAEHYVKPEAGMLVLFPSFLWHGTEPFGGEEPRLSIAFDIVPA